MGIGITFSKMNNVKMVVSKMMDIRLLLKQVFSICVL